MNHYIEITTNNTDMQYINFVLNMALRDEKIPSKDYIYLLTIARSLGFMMGSDWELLK